MILEGKGPTEIHKCLKALYKDIGPSYDIVKYWAKQFKLGRDSIEDDPKSGRPATSQNSEMAKNFEGLVLQDRRISVNSIANTLKISIKSAHTILHEQLHMNKVSARWVP